MVTVIRPSRARCVKGTIPRHERAVPNSAASGASVARGRVQAPTECRPAHDSDLISRDLFSATPLHFLSDLRDDVCARGFLRGRRGPPNNGKPTSGACTRLASITGSRLARPLPEPAESGLE